jgi:hypothetical protein
MPTAPNEEKQTHIVPPLACLDLFTLTLLSFPIMANNIHHHHHVPGAASNATPGGGVRTAAIPDVKIRNNTVESHSLSHLLTTAEKAVMTKSKESTIFDVSAEARIPKFDGTGTKRNEKNQNKIFILLPK